MCETRRKALSSLKCSANSGRFCAEVWAPASLQAPGPPRIWATVAVGTFLGGFLPPDDLYDETITDRHFTTARSYFPLEAGTGLAHLNVGKGLSCGGRVRRWHPLPAISGSSMFVTVLLWPPLPLRRCASVLGRQASSSPGSLCFLLRPLRPVSSLTFRRRRDGGAAKRRGRGLRAEMPWAWCQ